MKFIEFKLYFEPFLVFSLIEIKKKFPQFDIRRLHEWQSKGYIRKIIRSYYIFSDLELNEMTLFLVANKIYKPSYISFEMAFSYYHLIPEGVYSVTSATTKKTSAFSTAMGHFDYHSIKHSLMFGYILVKYHEHEIQIAEVEKAILDFLYIHSDVSSEDDFAGLRLNVALLSRLLNKAKFKKYLKMYDEKKLTIRANEFLTFLHHA